MTAIDRLIRALSEALTDPTEEAVARCLGMARAMRAEHEAEGRGWLQGYRVATNERDQLRRERDDAQADAERVRRGARCLRERCRRIEARARGMERRLALVNAAYWYATRLNDEMVAITPSSLSMARARLAVRYGDRTMVKAGELALKMLDVLAAGGSLAGIIGGTDERD